MEKITLNDLEKIELKGKTLIFPTDTVYGLGCLYNDQEAIDKIYRFKLRPLNKPLPILVHDYLFLEKVKNGFSFLEKLKTKWPGAHTAIFEIVDDTFKLASLSQKTTAFRMPNSKVCFTLLKRFGYLATTSVNISGSKPLSNLSEIEETFGDLVDYLVTDEEIGTKVASEIVDYTHNEERLR